MLNERNFKRAFFFFLRQNIDIDSFLKLNKFTQNRENDSSKQEKIKETKLNDKAYKKF